MFPRKHYLEYTLGTHHKYLLMLLRDVQVRQRAFKCFGRERDRFGECRVWVNGQADIPSEVVGNIGSHF